MQGATALHMAAHRGHTSVVQALGKLKSVEINAVDNNGRTALHHAAAKGHHNVVSELWALGCALELTDCVGWTGKYTKTIHLTLTLLHLDLQHQRTGTPDFVCKVAQSLRCHIRTRAEAFESALPCKHDVLLEITAK